MLKRVWRKGNPPVHLVVIQIGAGTMENTWRFLKKLKMELTHDQQSHYWAYIWIKLFWKDKCTLMFITALFILAKTWKQPKCPPIDEWINKMWYVYNKIIPSHKKEWNNAICNNWMDLEIVILSKVSHREEDKYHRISFICGIWKKWYKWTYLSNRNRLTGTENKLMITKGDSVGGEIN